MADSQSNFPRLAESRPLEAYQPVIEEKEAISAVYILAYSKFQQDSRTNNLLPPIGRRLEPSPLTRTKLDQSQNEVKY